jgi:hypothetical protein
LDLDDESVPDELARVFVRLDGKEFESNPEDRNIEHTALRPLRSGVVFDDVSA